MPITIPVGKNGSRTAARQAKNARPRRNARSIQVLPGLLIMTQARSAIRRQSMANGWDAGSNLPRLNASTASSNSCRVFMTKGP